MPTKVFGFIYFQRFYNEVTRSDEDVGKLAWQIELEKIANKYYREEWAKEYEKR
jgi:hypothetical protein